MTLKTNIHTPKVDAFPPLGVNDKPSTVGVLFSTMEKICGIYKITSPKKKIYIGQSVDVLKRFRTYHVLSCKSQYFLYHSLNKYGVEKHKFEIIHQCEKEQLNELEKYYVDLFQCFNSKYGLNLRDGGGRESKMRPITDEKRQNLSKSHIGQIAHNKGKKMSDEQYEKCKNTMFKKGGIGIRKGVVTTNETKEKQRKAKLNIRLSEEHKKNISKSLVGKNTWTKGCKKSLTSIENSKIISKNRQRNEKGQYVQSSPRTLKRETFSID